MENKYQEHIWEKTILVTFTLKAFLRSELDRLKHETSILQKSNNTSQKLNQRPLPTKDLKFAMQFRQNKKKWRN